MHKVKLFRVVAYGNRMDWVIINDLSQYSTGDAKDMCYFLED